MALAVLRLGRFKTGPAGTGEMLASRVGVAAAIEDAFPGLIEMQLAKAGDQRWTGVWLSLRTSRSNRNSAFFGPQPHQFGSLIAGQALGLAALDLVLGDPVAQRALMNPKVTGHLGDRFPRSRGRSGPHTPGTPDRNSPVAIIG
jgi:hypothetical protein